MSEYRDDAVLTETLERIRRAELACVLYPPGTPEHARAVERLDRATRQMRRLAAATAGDAVSTVTITAPSSRGPADQA